MSIKEAIQLLEEAEELGLETLADLEQYINYNKLEKHEIVLSLVGDNLIRNLRK